VFKRRKYSSGKENKIQLKKLSGKYISGKLILKIHMFRSGKIYFPEN